MDLKTRNEKIAAYWQEQREILDRKGADYTGGKLADNANSNFDEVARRLAGAVMSPLTVWAVYWEKQIIAIETFVRTGRLESEGVASRFNDIANYTNIGRTIVEEQSDPVEQALSFTLIAPGDWQAKISPDEETFFIVCPSCKTRYTSRDQLRTEPGELNQSQLACPSCGMLLPGPVFDMKYAP